MARPREFDETAVLDAAVEHFWLFGYQAASIRELAVSMGITGASLYNAFGDKRALFRIALARYAQINVDDRIKHFEGGFSSRKAIEGFFRDVIGYSLRDKNRKGCLLVNSALELDPEDDEMREVVRDVFIEIEAFFKRAVAAGQETGEIPQIQSAEDLARLLLGALLGIRVLARVRPNRALLDGIVRAALSLLDHEAV
jgi:TetR/AcrR family transcriptional regulator, transcriptional repressor for nem operon